MTLPPPDGWPPPQQPSQPFDHGQPYGPPGHPPQPPPPGWPQSTPPPKQGGGLKWLLIGVAVLLVIGITIGATLLFTRGVGGSTTAAPGGASDIASANDTGPVSVITTEPTCNAFVSINNSLADIQANGWGEQRSTLGMRQDWTPDQLAQVESVKKATQNAADQMIPLARQTPNRVVARLYEQFIAYGRAYANSIDNYVPADNGLASANVNASSALVGICNAITYGSAARPVALDPAEPPSGTGDPVNVSNPERFITKKDAACTSFQQLSDKFDVDAAEWQRMDSSTPSSQWTPDQRATQLAALPAMSAWADGMEKAGRDSGNPTLEDLAATAAVYLRAYVSAGDNYTGTDSWLSYVSIKLNQVVLGACRAASG